ncbi:MAG: hypothetical protein U0931_07180 [Vulcanimicrobiota bacterium]
MNKAEVQQEVSLPGEQVTLSGNRAPVETAPPPGPAAQPEAPPQTRETPGQAPSEQPAPGPGISAGQGGTLLMTETPAAEHSASVDGFLTKFLAQAGVQSTRTPDLAAIKVSPEAVSAQNMKFMNSPGEAKEHFQKLMGDKPVQLATAGYSAPPEGYEAPTTKFLSGLTEELSGKIGLVTSPTADKGSIDAITSTVGQRAGAPLGYITADSYLGYVNPDNFPQDIDKNQFSAQPKIAFPDADIYSKATAELSNSFLVTGGRNASVNDFKNAVLNGNQVVVLTNDDVKSPSWDPKKNRVDNASAYLSQMMAGNTDGIPMDNPFNQEVAKFLADNKEAISKQVISVDANDAGAIKTAAAHLQGGGGVEAPNTRNMDAAALANLKVTPEKVDELNIKFLNTAEEAKGFMQDQLGGKSVQLATAGYSAPPAGYEGPTREFLGKLSDALGGDVALLTSPTADKGSIDAISSEVAQKAGLPVGYVTADNYLEYVNPDNFSAEMNKDAFGSVPKFAFPNGDEYSRATSVLSNSFLLTGGRNAAISDFQHAIEHGNKAVVLDNSANEKPAWDAGKNRVDNGSAYVAKFLRGDLEGIPMDQPFNQKFAAFVEANRDKIEAQTLVVNAQDGQAAQQAAAFLKG